MQKTVLFFLLLVISIAKTFSQEKFEKEYRVKPTDVPQKSFDFINSLDFKKKVKWYAEESQDGKTYETKVKYNGYKYSIEFSEKGEIIDVEKTVSFSELPLGTRENIHKSLSIRFKKFKIKKTQIQFLSSSQLHFKVLFNSNLAKEKFHINYELVVKGKTENDYDQFEILINAAGEILKELKFNPSNSINLEF